MKKKKRKFFCCDRIFIQALSLHRYWALGLNMALTQFNIHSGFPFTFFVVIFILLSRFTPKRTNRSYFEANNVGRSSSCSQRWQYVCMVSMKASAGALFSLSFKINCKISIHCSVCAFMVVLFFCYSPPFLWLLTILALLYFFGMFFVVVVVVFLLVLKWMHIILTLPSKCCEYTISKHQVTKQ